MKRIVSIVMIAVATFAFANAAVAQERPARTPDPEKIEALRTRCLEGIDRRLERITRLKDAVNGSEHVTAEHRSTLSAQLTDARSGLTELRTKIEGDTDPAALKHDCRSIVEDYRIYVLVSPKVREVLVADAEVAVSGHLDEVAAKIQAAIDEASAKGKDTTQAQSYLDEMKAGTESARTAASGVPASIINLTPADWPGAHDTLEQGRETLRTARKDLYEAREAGRNAVKALRGAKEQRFEHGTALPHTRWRRRL
jgi:hypothetical protein